MSRNHGKAKRKGKASKTSFLRNSNEDCLICLDQIKFSGQLSGCPHTFCLDCIGRWSRVSNTCPVCNAPFSVLRSVSEDGTPSERPVSDVRQPVWYPESFSPGDWANFCSGESDLSDSDPEPWRPALSTLWPPAPLWPGSERSPAMNLSIMRQILENLASRNPSYQLSASNATSSEIAAPRNRPRGSAVPKPSASWVCAGDTVASERRLEVVRRISDVGLPSCRPCRRYKRKRLAVGRR